MQIPRLVASCEPGALIMRTFESIFFFFFSKNTVPHAGRHDVLSGLQLFFLKSHEAAPHLPMRDEAPRRIEESNHVTCIKIWPITAMIFVSSYNS